MGRSALIEREVTDLTGGNQLRVLMISGSTAEPSHTLTNLRLMEALLAERGVEVRCWDLKQEPLPIHNPLYHRDPHTNPSEGVRRLAGLAQWAHAVVLGTPVMHGSISGALKNALDNLSVGQFWNKPVALISNAGGQGGAQACDHMRLIVRALHGVAIPNQVATADADFEMCLSTYELVNGRIYERFVALADELVLFARALSPVCSQLSP